MFRPAAANARSADSRPEPGPCTSTSSVFTPCSCALRRCILGSHLGSIRSRFTRPFKAHGARRRPRDCVALNVRDQDFCVVERRIHMRNASGDVFAFLTLHTGLIACHISAPLISSCQQWPLQGLCGYVRWYECADHEPAGHDGGAGHGSNQGPSRRLMFIDVSRRRSPSTVKFASICSRIASTSASESSFTRRVRSMPTASQIMLCGVGTDPGDIGQCDGDTFPRRNVYASNTSHARLPFVAVPLCQNLFSQPKNGESALDDFVCDFEKPKSRNDSLTGRRAIWGFDPPVKGRHTD